MKTEEIKELFEQFESIVCLYDGVECWSARELCSVLGYVQWRYFEQIIDMANRRVCPLPIILPTSAK